MQPESDLTQLSNTAAEVARNMPTPPSRVRVQHADTSVELEWDVAEIPVTPVAPEPVQPSEPVQPPEPVADQQVHHVRSPIVGAFYRGPEPGAAPFVEEGSRVHVGQQVAIVEAMKLMLPVEADQAGTVVTILKKGGEFVEYGEPLYTLEL